MQLGMIGLGRMGANLTRRLMRDGHQMVVWNRDPAPIATLAGEGAVGAESPADLVEKLERPRAVWIMVSAGVTGKVVGDLRLHIEHRALVPALEEPPHHVSSHPAQSDHSELHRDILR